MTSTFAFAQTQTPYAKGKYYGEKTISTAAFSDNEEDGNKLIKSIENYILQNIETGEQMLSFIEGYEAGVRKACEYFDLGKEVADAIIDEVINSIIEAAEAVASL